MYEFYYNYIERKFNAKLMFTETDNLLYEIETNDVYKDFPENKDLFGFSDYPRDSKFFDPVIGKTKDEFKGKIVTEFVGLKSKMYSLIDVDNEENKKAKRVEKT